ncbi:hypothetical protein [Acinetobacter phage vB_AbaS_TCUP2199]|nr:hypothetical protein [Acinetobacter phage vB_AbaS_TCUP2199]
MADKNLFIEIIWDPSPIAVTEKIARQTLVVELPIGVMLGGGGGGGSGGDYIPTSEKGQAGGVAELDSTGKVPASQLPAAQTGDFIPKSEKGQPLGVATLAEDGLVDWRQLPAGPDLSGFIMTWQMGQPNGVATLDSSGLLAAYQLPALDFIPTSAIGQPWGIPQLNSEGKVLSSMLPPFPDLDFIPMSYKGQNGGVAELDFTGKVPTEQINFPVTMVNGKTGNLTLVAADVNADPVGTAATLSAQAKNQAVAQVHAEIDGTLSNLQNNKLDKVDYVQHFRGLFSSYAALTAALPTASVGDYAHIDSGSGFDRLSAIWDNDDNKWVVNQVNVAHNTDEMPEGSNNLYFTGARTRAVPLTGLIIPNNKSPIVESDTILQALGKLQGSINNSASAGTDAVWVDSKTVGNWDAQMYTDQFTRLEFARWQGCLWVRGWMFLKNITSTTYPFEFTNPKYKIINPFNPNTEHAWIEAFYSGNANGSQTQMVSFFSGGVINNAATAASVQQRIRGVIAIPPAGILMFVRAQALGILADPS